MRSWRQQHLCLPPKGAHAGITVAMHTYEGHWTDGDGRVLPDALLVKRGTTSKGLAYSVHSDLGDGFIRAVDARTGRVIGAEQELSDNDVIKIVAKT